MTMRKIAIAVGVGLMMIAGATGRSDHTERLLTNGQPSSYGEILRLSESQKKALQAQFKYWRAQTDDYSQLNPPH